MIEIIKGVFYYSGFEYIYRKVKPAKAPRPLPTLPLWLIGIYVATFGVASQRYENRVDVIENKANTIYSQLASPNPVTKGMAFRMILDIQQMECPYKPEITNPVSIYLSFFRQSTYVGVENLMKETVENWKGSLSSVDFSNFELKGYDLDEAKLDSANLVNANLMDTNFERAIFHKADLRGAILHRAILRGAQLDGVKLNGADLKDAKLGGSNLERAKLVGANLESAKLYGAKFNGTDLQDANFRGAFFKRAEYSAIKQLSVVKTLYDAKGLDQGLMEQLKEEYPRLLEKPDEAESKQDE